MLHYYSPQIKDQHPCQSRKLVVVHSMSYSLYAATLVMLSWHMDNLMQHFRLTAPCDANQIERLIEPEHRHTAPHTSSYHLDAATMTSPLTR
jgi:hypothetical protein